MPDPIEFTVYANIYPDSIFGYSSPKVPVNLDALLSRVPLRVRIDGSKVSIVQIEKPTDAISNASTGGKNNAN